MDTQAFATLENIPPGKVDVWNQLKTKYMAQRRVITRKIYMWNNRLEATKLTKETAKGASVSHLSYMIKKTEKDLGGGMNVLRI